MVGTTLTNQTIDAIRFGSFLVESRFTIYQNGVPTTEVLPISTMTINVDRNSSQRRSGTIDAQILAEIPPLPLMPTSPSSLLAPFGTEVFVETGIGTADGVLQWVPVGLFDIATTSVSDLTTDMTIGLKLYDRSWVIAQRKFLKPYNVPAASGNFVDEIETLLTAAWGSNVPALQFSITPTNAVVPPNTYNQGSDPWAAAEDMAAVIGYELYFDVNGVVTGVPIPNPTLQPISWNFSDDPTYIYGGPGQGSTGLLGSAYSSPAECVVTFTRDQIYNDVIVAGTGTQNVAGSASGSSAPVLAEAADTNTSSATFIGGPMGDIPEFISTNIVITQDQAQTMANNELQAALSAAWQISVTGPPNPSFDIDQVCTITRPRLGLNNVKFVIDSITHAVSYADMMTVTGRVVA